MAWWLPPSLQRSSRLWPADRGNTGAAGGVGPGMTSLLKPLRCAIALAALWAVFAWNSPSMTYHLAPLLVAGITPAALLLSDESTPLETVLGAGAIGASLALATTAGLGLAERLIGPSLLPTGGAG